MVEVLRKPDEQRIKNVECVLGGRKRFKTVAAAPGGRRLRIVVKASTTRLKCKTESLWLVVTKLRFGCPPPRSIAGRVVHDEDLGGRWVFFLLLGFHASRSGWYDRIVPC